MKKLASLVLAGAMAFSLAACGNNSTPAGGSSANAGTSTPAASTPASGGIEPIELTIYSPGNENSVPTKTIIEYARLVNEASDGAITLDVHHSNELGSDAESIESTRMGTIDLIFAGTSGFTSFYEKAKVLDLPFLFDSAEQAYEVTNSEIGEQIFSGLEEFGLVFLSEGDNGMRHISTTNRPVHTAADVQGLKDQGTIAGGMIPKVDCCVQAIEEGVTNVHIIDGRKPHSILYEAFTDEGIGTTVGKDVPSVGIKWK